MNEKPLSLCELVDSVGVGPLSRALGVGQRYIRKILCGERNLSAGFIRRCISVYGDSFDLLTSWDDAEKARKKWLSKKVKNES